MKLTSLLLVQALSDSDYILVNVSKQNTSYTCTDNNVVLANLSQQQLIANCIATHLDVTSVGIDLNAICQEINR